MKTVFNLYKNIRYRFVCRAFRRKEDIMGSKAPYQTKQMAQLLSYLRTVEGTHVTVADVCLHFKEQGITIGTTTVYRNLERMVEQGLVAKYNVDGTSSACFEYLGAEEHCHKTSCFHCKCEKCGKLIHLHCEDVVKLEQHLMESHGFQMDLLHARARSTKHIRQDNYLFTVDTEEEQRILDAAAGEIGVGV